MEREIAAFLQKVQVECFDRFDSALAFPESAPATLARYLSLLERWTERVDLISRAKTEVNLRRHIFDCCAAVSLLESAVRPAAELSAADLGSGSGLPGLVHAVLFPRRKVHLIEPRRKRCVFLGEARRLLSIDNIKVHECRVEELELGAIDPVGIITVRALKLGRAEILSCAALLRPGGVLVRMLGRPALEPSALSEETASISGALIEYSVPGGGDRALALHRFT